MRFARFSTCALVSVLLASNTANAAAADSADLTPAESTADALVKVVLEVDGKLLPQPSSADDDSKEKSSSGRSLKAIGNFLYQERMVDDTARTALRYYDQAAAEVAIERSPRSLELRADRRLVAVDPQAKTLIFRALEGTLTRDELELIDLPAGSHLVDQLMPSGEKTVGDTWKHEDVLVARLLNLDSVTSNEVESTLKSVDDASAQIEIVGSVKGTVAGVATEIQLQAKLTFNRQHRFVSWVALGLKEERKVGLTLPGLIATSRVRLLRELSPSTHLADADIPDLVAGLANAPELLEFQPDSKAYSLTLDPRWYVYRQQHDLVVLRMVENGRVIGQCNLHALPPLAVGKQLDLAKFQAEVRDALGEAATQIIDAREDGLPNNIRQLRVAVVGQVSELPIQWIYYHLDDADNRRVSCVFTLGAEDLEAFAASDFTLVSGLDLSPAAESEPTQPAPVVSMKDDEAKR